MNWNKCKVKPNRDFQLSKIDMEFQIKQSDKKELKAELSNDIQQIAKLQNKLYAESRQSPATRSKFKL